MDDEALQGESFVSHVMLPFTGLKMHSSVILTAQVRLEM